MVEGSKALLVPVSRVLLIPIRLLVRISRHIINTSINIPWFLMAEYVGMRHGYAVFNGSLPQHYVSSKLFADHQRPEEQGVSYLIQ